MRWLFRRGFFAALGLIVLPVALAFAGGAQETGKSGQATQAGSGTVSVWDYWGSGGELQAINALLQVAQKAYPSYVFQNKLITGSTPEMRRALGEAFLGGNPPEVYQSGMGYDLLTFVKADRLMPIDDVWSAVNGDKIFPAGLVRVVKFQGHAWGIPLNMGVISNIWYNKAIFAKYNLTPPKTWDEFNAVVKTLQDNGVQALADAAGPFWSLYNFYAPLISVLGVDGYYALAAGKLSFKDPKVRQAFDLYRNTYIAAYMKDWSGYSWPQAADQLIQGNVAMYGMGDWASAYFKSKGLTPDIDYGFFPAPGIGHAVLIQVDVFPAPKGSLNPSGAKALLKVAAGVEGQDAFNKYKGSIAANVNADPSIYDAIGKAESAELTSPDAVVIPNMAFLLPTQLSDALGHGVESFANNPTDQNLDQILTSLENLRLELAAERAFMSW